MRRFALVTGAARGIGREIALELVKDNWPLVLLDIDEERLEETTRLVQARGHWVQSVVADLADRGSIDQAVKTVAKIGRAGALVNNAGILGPVGPALQLSMDDWRRVMAVNLEAPWLLSQALLSDLSQTGGSIVNLASRAGLDGSPGLVVYAVSKAGLIGLTRTLAREWAAHKVRVNAILPGLIDTELSARLTEEIRENLLKIIPLGRSGTPCDVAPLVRFLVSNSAGYVTGQAWSVDGGR